MPGRFLFSLFFILMTALPSAHAEDPAPAASISPSPEPSPSASPSLPPAPPQPEAPRYQVEADFSKPIGDATQITDFFGAGGSIYLVGGNVDDPVFQTWRDLGFKQVSFETLHLEDPNERWVKVTIDENKAVQVDFSDYDRYLRTYLDSLRAKPFVYLGNIPRALSSKPEGDDYSVYPPKNMKQWQEFVKKIVKRNLDKFKLRGINYGVLGEPDHPDSWKGTMQEHVELYAATYRAVKAVDKSARVGGPSATTWKGTKGWIRALAEYNKKNPGKEAGLDYISWQDYGWEGEFISKGADAVSGYLKDNGFDPQTPKMLAGSGWGSWSSNYLEEQTPWQRASFVMANIIREFKNPEQRKFHEAIYYSFYFNDFWITPGTEKEMNRQRSTAMLIIPKEGRYRQTPVFAAFQMAQAMSTGHIVQSSSSGVLEAMATVDEAGQKAVVTVTNHTPELVISEFSLSNLPFDLNVVKPVLKSIDEFHSTDGHGIEEGFDIEPKMEEKTAKIAIFVKPYGTLQIVWRVPPPPAPVETPAEEQVADDDIRPGSNTHTVPA